MISEELIFHLSILSCSARYLIHKYHYCSMVVILGRWYDETRCSFSSFSPLQLILNQWWEWHLHQTVMKGILFLVLTFICRPNTLSQNEKRPPLPTLVSLPGQLLQYVRPDQWTLRLKLVWLILNTICSVGACASAWLLPSLTAAVRTPCRWPGDCRVQQYWLLWINPLPMRTFKWRQALFGKAPYGVLSAAYPQYPPLCTNNSLKIACFYPVNE